MTGKRKATSEAVADVKPDVKQQPRSGEKKKVKQQAGGTSRADAITLEDDDDRGTATSNEVLLGHLVTSCVGIHHYSGNGLRYNREPLRLKREPNNPYDRNAIAVHELTHMQKVGHVPRVDAIALARVADGLNTLMVGEVERGAGQTYKFPMRISFFGPEGTEPAISRILQMAGLALTEPKRRGRAPPKSGGRSAAPPGRGVSGAVGGASSSQRPAASSAVNEEGDDEIEFTGEKTWEERDAELRAQAVVLD